MSGRFFICGLVGAATEFAVRALLGLIVIPLLTQQWLFTTSAAAIRRVGGPALVGLGGWLGAVVTVARFDRSVESCRKRVTDRATWLPVTVAALAVLVRRGSGWSVRWLEGIANYFVSRSSNGRTERFNHGLRSVLWRAFGLRNFHHFCLRILDVFGRPQLQEPTGVA